MISALRIALVGDFNRQQRAHQAIPHLLHGISNDIECIWVSSEAAATEPLADFHGIWVVPGMPYRNTDGVLRAIRYARVSRTPFIGTSAGFQYTLIEYARDVAGLSAADHQKTAPNAAIPLITPLELGLAGVHARVHYSAGSKLRAAYRAAESVEEYHCSFGLNGRYRRLLEGRDLYISAVDDLDEVRAVELDGHPFFVATLFQPELRSGSNPVAEAFVAVCDRRRTAVKVAS